jgi:hypothetical protein
MMLFFGFMCHQRQKAAINKRKPSILNELTPINIQSAEVILGQGLVFELPCHMMTFASHNKDF